MVRGKVIIHILTTTLILSFSCCFHSKPAIKRNAHMDSIKCIKCSSWENDNWACFMINLGESYYGFRLVPYRPKSMLLGN